MAGVITGNVQSIGVVSVALSPAQVAANTTSEQTFTVPGVLSTDLLGEVNKPSSQAGLGIAGIRVTAANTIGITFSNNTGAGITPTASETYKFLLVRPDSTQAGFNV